MKFRLIILLFSSILLFLASCRHENNFQSGWKYPCEKSEFVYVEINKARLKIPYEHARQFGFNQSDEQEQATPPDIFCKNSEVKWMEVEFLSFRLRPDRGRVKDYKAHFAPLGVKHIFIPGYGRQPPCSTSNVSGRKEVYNYEKLETCYLVTKVPEADISVEYHVTTHPYVYNGEVRTEDDWPYKYYPRDTWPQLEKDMQNYVLSLLYAEPQDGK